MGGSDINVSGHSPDSLPWFSKVRDILSAGSMVEFAPKGYSMWPTLRPGCDRVCVRAEAEYHRSDIVLASGDSPQGVFLHRVVRVLPDRLILMGDSNLYQTELCRPENVIGRVVVISRRGRDISGSAGLRLLAAVHRMPPGLRRLAVRIMNFRRNGKAGIQ